MKLGVVIPSGVGRHPEDGTIPCLRWLVERLARQHEVHLFPRLGARPPDPYTFLGATVHPAPGARPRTLRMLTAIMAEDRRGPFDMLHAFWVVPQGVIAACAGKLLGCPVVAHVTGGELVTLPDIGYGGRRTWRGRMWVRIGLSGATRITATCAPIIRDLGALGYAAEQIPLGVDLTRWPLVAPRARQAGRTARLVHVADLNRVKDQPTLLLAARRLADRGVDFHLDIAGEDTLGGAIEALTRQLGLGERVRFHGRVPHEQLYSLVKEADMLCMSSRHEAGQLVVLEAAIAGLPTVGTAVGYIAEWAPDAAVAVPVRDAHALADEILKLLQDDERRLRLAREAQRRALACDVDWTAQRLDSLYHELLSEARPRGRDR
jgi:glycosyltransferase involved in cell wall biosynthesis